MRIVDDFCIVVIEVCDGLYYVEIYEWVKVDGDIGIIGIFDYV